MQKLSCVGGRLANSARRKIREQVLFRTIVVLIRNTTWRCGKVEKSIVKHLYKMHKVFGKPGTSVKEIIENLDFATDRKSECIDALKRLEKRNIVRMLSL